MKDVDPHELHRELRAHAGIKRFFERWNADPDFREAVLEDDAPLAEVGDPLTPAELRSLRARDAGDLFDWPPMQRIWRVARAKAWWVQGFYQQASLPADPVVRAWRERQIRRQVHDLGPFHAGSNIHASVAFELCAGCSVGCWFCALSPSSLEGVYAWTPAHAEEFTGMLRALQGWLGPALGSGFLYWATEPLDNPDYERFCLAFHEVTGVFPPTTTARALADVDRTRALLALSAEHGCWLNRFSVPGRRLMARIHRTFSAEELARVECLPLNREAAFTYGNAGRFRERALRDPSLLDAQKRKLAEAPWHAASPGYRESDEYANGSIGCVTGLIVNTVRRQVQLVSPCTADDSWPDGSIVFAEAEYDGVGGFEEALGRLYGSLPVEVGPDHLLALASPLRFEETARGFDLRGRFGTVDAIVAAEDESPDAVRTIGRAIAGGDRPTVAALESVGPAARIASDLFHRGLLDERVLHG